MKLGLGSVFVLTYVLGMSREARADDATVSVGQRLSEPPPEPSGQPTAPIAVDDTHSAPGRFGPERERELHRAPFRLPLSGVL